MVLIYLPLLGLVVNRFDVLVNLFGKITDVFLESFNRAEYNVYIGHCFGEDPQCIY